jgi:hypothetical protein
MAQVTIWGEGGFDPSKPNNNIIDQYEVADSEPTEQELAKASAMAKLKALGLSDAEVAALLG